MVDKLLIGVGCLFLAYGFFGLVGTWLVPTLGRSRLYGSGMLMGRLEPNRINRTIMSLWALFFGGYFAASLSGHRTLGYISFLAFLLCAITALVIRYRRGR